MVKEEIFGLGVYEKHKDETQGWLLRVGGVEMREGNQVAGVGQEG